jgi:hypothetical protein
VLFKKGDLNRNEWIRIYLNKTKIINQINLASLIQPKTKKLKKTNYHKYKLGMGKN